MINKNHLFLGNDKKVFLLTRFYDLIKVRIKGDNVDNLNNLLWSIATVMLTVSGIYFAFKLKFLHLNFKEIYYNLFKKKKDNKGISPFASLMVSLGGCIGVGSLAGIALAIYKGGVGTIFWIWLSCLIMAPNSLVENLLAVVYQKKKGNEYQGGPPYYIKYGLGYKKLAMVFAFIVAFAYIVGFLTIQSNTIAVSITNFFDFPKLLIGIIIAVLSFIIIHNGLKGIATFSSIFVPIMGLLYFGVSLFIVIKNINLMPSLLANIIHEAFNFKALGYGMFSVILIGIQRGIFSNEAGVGTASIASGSSGSKSPISQGLIQTIGVYITTFIICTGTAFIILTSNYTPNMYTDVNGIEITQNALYYHLGNLGTVVLYFCIIAFSFSTIISGYYYGEVNMKFLFKKMNEKHILLLKIITCVLLAIGAILSPNFLWSFVDILVAILAIINVYAMLSLRGDVLLEYQTYKANKNKNL